jgi:UDP:flavonoid glycosyltransferase YjiC (YdhE family)
MGGVVAGPIPANARVATFLPYAHLLPRVSIVTTNAGFGAVQFALALLRLNP